MEVIDMGYWKDNFDPNKRAIQQYILDLGKTHPQPLVNPEFTLVKNVTLPSELVNKISITTPTDFYNWLDWAVSQAYQYGYDTIGFQANWPTGVALSFGTYGKIWKNKPQKYDTHGSVTGTYSPFGDKYINHVFYLRTKTPVITISNGIKYNTVASGASIIFYPSDLIIKNENQWTLNLPSSIDSYKVVGLVYDATSGQTSINNNTYYSTNTFVNITINVPSSIKSIYAFAFRNLSLGNSNIVNLSEGLLTIGIRTFSGFKMDSIILPSTILYIYDFAFENTNLKNIYFGGNVNINTSFWATAFSSIRTSSTWPYPTWEIAKSSITTISTLPYPTLYITDECRITSGLTFGQLWNNVYIQLYVKPTTISLAEYFGASNKNQSFNIFIILIIVLISIIIYYYFHK
jgi:hypothetical protein